MLKITLARQLYKYIYIEDLLELRITFTFSDLIILSHYTLLTIRFFFWLEIKSDVQI